MRPLALIIGGLILAFGLPPMPTLQTFEWPEWIVVTDVATAAVYVHEKDDSAIPSGVMAGLNRLNRERGIVATVFEDDTTTGDGEVPEQYREPLRAAREAGLPSFIVMSGNKVARVVKAPTTAEQLMEAVP